MSVGDPGKQLREIISCLPHAKLEQAGAHADEAATIFHRLAEGSSSSELADAIAMLGVTRERIDELWQRVDQARRALENYLERLGAGAESATSPEPGASAPLRPRTHADHLERIRRNLTPPPEGGRTLGAWINEHGQEEELRSGEEDPWFEEACLFAQEWGLVRPGGKPTFARHVELRFATRMRKKGIRKATIVIDRKPCGIDQPRRRSCDELLPIYLEPDAELTVIVRTGARYIYRGAAE